MIAPSPTASEDVMELVKQLREPVPFNGPDGLIVVLHAEVLTRAADALESASRIAPEGDGFVRVTRALLLFADDLEDEFVGDEGGDSDHKWICDKCIDGPHFATEKDVVHTPDCPIGVLYAAVDLLSARPPLPAGGETVWTEALRGACALRCGDFGEPACWQVVENCAPCQPCFKAAGYAIATPPLPAPDDGEIEESLAKQLLAAQKGLIPLSRQGEDYIWRPVRRAINAISEALKIACPHTAWEISQNELRCVACGNFGKRIDEANATPLRLLDARAKLEWRGDDCYLGELRIAQICTTAIGTIWRAWITDGLMPERFPTPEAAKQAVEEEVKKRMGGKA